MSNLLEKASIITTPTAYSDGKLHSVKPVKTLGDEKVVNGDFATDSDWNKAASWSISNNSANSDGTQSVGTLTQNTTSLAGKYFIEFQLKEYTQGNVGMSITGTGGQDIRVTNGVLGFYNTTITTPTDNFQIEIKGDSNFIGSIDNVSVKEVTDADFDFQRGSAATRVNSQGLIENVQTLSGNLVQNGDFSEIGSELVTNGDFATDSDWTKTSTVTISNGVANIVSDGSYQYLAQSSITTQNKFYKLVYTIVSNNNGALKFSNGSTSYGGLTSTVGTHTKYFKANTGTSVFIERQAGATDITIDNVSVKEVGQDWALGTGWSIGEDKAINDGTINQSLLQTNVFTIGKSYKINFTISDVVGSLDARIWMATGGAKIEANANGNYTTYWEADGTDLYTTTLSTNTATYSITNISVIEITDDTDLPRIDYTDGCGSLLLEPQSTNSVVYSEDFTTGTGWGNFRCTLDSNVLISPDGQQTASKLTDTIVLGDRGLAQINSSLASNSYALFSVFLKAGTNRYGLLFIIDNAANINGGANSFSIVIDLQDGIITDTGIKQGTPQNTTYGIENYNNGWFRVYIGLQKQGDATRTDLRFIMYDEPDWNPGQSYTGDGTGTSYIWGAQLEQLSYPTSYIPTNGSTVTRNADVCNNAGSSDLINSTEGVLYGEFSTNNTDSPNWLNISDTTAVNWLFLGKQDGDIRVYLRANNSVILDYTKPLEDKNKIALSYKSGDIKVYINGINVDNSTSTFSFTSALSRIDFNQYNGGGTQTQIAWKALAVFKEALTNDELEGLTGEGYDTFNALALANNYTII